MKEEAVRFLEYAKDSDLYYEFKMKSAVPSLHTSWSEIWCDWLRAEKHKTDVTFSLWLQENYNVPSKK